jgi:cell division protein FtsB
MITVLVVIAVLWISAVASLLSSHAQAERGLAQVRRLAAEHRALLTEQRSLHQRSTILSHARALGMVKQGEQSFIVVNP